MASTVSTQSFTATLMQGHRVASGQNGDERFPVGTIAAQKPKFKQLGLDLSACHNGTLNLCTLPIKLSIRKADFHFENVTWTTHLPQETFSFVSFTLVYKKQRYHAYWYLPHPETKVEHFQHEYTIEVVCPFIVDIKYGNKVELIFDSNKIQICT